MQKINLKLDDAPLILSSVYANSNLSINWPKQTTWLTPAKLPKKIASQYEEKMEWILRQYKALQMQDSLRPIAPHVLPYAAKLSLELSASPKDLIASVRQLETIPLDYTFEFSKSLSSSFTLNNPYKDKPDIQVSSSSYVTDRKRIRLVEATPINEFDVVALDTYFESGQSWHDNQESAQALSYVQKENKLKRLLANNLVTDFRYVFEIVAEPLVVKELHSSQIFNRLTSQAPTPAHGYNIPKINDGGMIERCFDMSYELYSLLQTVRPEAAQLSCLYGHRQRCLATIGIDQLKLLYNRQIKYSLPAINIIKFMRKEISLKHQTIHAWFDDKKE